MASVVVIGGGVFGLTAALEMRRRGWEVTVLDQGPIPHPDASSTDISKVLRMDYGADGFYMDLMRRAFEGWDEWNAGWGETLYRETGVLMLSRAEMAPGGYEHESFRLLQERGLAVERMDSVEIRRRFPAWNADRYVDGYFNPRGGWAASGRVVARLASEIREAGGALLESAGFAGFIKEGGRVTGVRTERGDRIFGDHVVLAAGAWTPFLHPPLQAVMWPTAQDVFHFQVDDVEMYRPPRFPVYTADVSNTGWYGFPAKLDGTLKVANHGPGRRIDPSGPRQVADRSLPNYRAFFEDTFPGLAGAPRTFERVCFYADTFDGDFWIDRDPENPGLVVASGGSGHAFKFAPVLGAITADAVEGVPNPDASRFGWRKAGQLRTEDARNA
ncbi:MAG TPA: FAD-dependent oxidoreductase [Anaerolineales bacterium]|nr:FAD-dependent oxidoreductase [Anaerolineales bacterium]